MNTINVNARYLAALLDFAPKGDVNHYMHGANIKTGPTGAVGYATDGHAMLVIRLDTEFHHDNWLFAPSCWKIPAALGKAMCRVPLSSATEGDALTSTLELPGTTLTWQGTAHRVPDIDRVIPRSVSGELAAFSPELVQKLYKAGRALGEKFTPQIVHNGPTGAALVQFDDPNVFGVIMPMKEDLHKEPPAWYTAPDGLAAAPAHVEAA